MQEATTEPGKVRGNVDLVSSVDAWPEGSTVRWIDHGRAPEIPGARRVVPVPAFVLTPTSIPMAIRVEGNCMAPTIQDGDTVIADCAREWVDGDIVAAVAGNHGLVIKRAYHDGEGIRLQATNGYEIKGESVHILGRIVYSTHPVPRRKGGQRKNGKGQDNHGDV